MKIVGVLAAALLIFCCGIGTGVEAMLQRQSHLMAQDPLRQDSPAMEAWFAANITGNTETMWDNSSSDFQTKYPGGKAQFLIDYKHDPSKDPPKIAFQASVKLMGFGSELFYIVSVSGGERMTIPVYVDDQGKFDSFAS